MRSVLRCIARHSRSPPTAARRGRQAIKAPPFETWRCPRKGVCLPFIWAMRLTRRAVLGQMLTLATLPLLAACQGQSAAEDAPLSTVAPVEPTLAPTAVPTLAPTVAPRPTAVPPPPVGR